MNSESNKPNKYMVLLIVSLGTVLSGYVSSSLDIALSNIMNTFGFTMDNVTWVLLAYMIPYGATLPIMGKLGDQFGRKKMYILGCSVFTVATMMVGMAWSSTTVVLFRIIQGIGAGMFFPNAMALVSDAFPPSERGQALGMWGAFAAAGGVLGPIIGGYIVEYVSWRMLFSSIVPVAAIGIFLAIFVLQESEINGSGEKIDYLGGLLLVTSLSSLIIALNQGAKEGWTSLYILGLFAVMILSMTTFIYVESHIEYPLINLELFRNPTFTVANLVGFLTFMTLNGGLFLIPFFLRNILGYTPIKAGLSLFPLVGSLILLAPLGGKLADKVNAKTPTIIGMLILSIAMYSFRTMTEHTSYSFIALRLILMGTGLALTMSPLSNAVMATLPKDKTGVGSGVYNLFKNVGGSVGIAMMGTMLDQRQLFHKQIISTHVNTSSETAQQMITQIQGMLVHNGIPAEQAYAVALSSLKGLVTKQAAIMAYSDVFQITAGLAALGVIMAMMLKDNKKVPEAAANCETVIKSC
ncbi:DHA2 family efflux MFS transporter permease subunit [Pelosinus sp. sgz500959]|uniref:DHA2 family efflux MFS transporter permease subunit n=1 Tax=Pelosinus sp. sgz500959 TaxID=3242472 RepID=UPI00366E7575